MCAVKAGPHILKRTLFPAPYSESPYQKTSVLVKDEVSPQPAIMFRICTLLVCGLMAIVPEAFASQLNCVLTGAKLQGWAAPIRRPFFVFIVQWE